MLVALTAADFLRYLTWAVFALLGVWAAARAVIRPTAVNIDTGLLFGCLAAVIFATVLVHFGMIGSSLLLQLITTTVLFAMPFLLVRLMNDVVGVPRRALIICTLTFAACVGVFWLTPGGRPGPLSLLILLALVGMIGYVVLVGLRAIVHTRGITRRRLIAATLGSLFLALNFSAGSLPAVLPITAADARSLVDVSGLAAGICYLIGFAPPRWLRRAWQGPELRAFLAQATRLALLGDPREPLAQLERRAAAAFGAPYASIGRWDEAAQELRFVAFGQALSFSLTSDVPVIRAFTLQRALFSRHTRYDSPGEGAINYDEVARAVLVAPVTLGERRLGVLSVYGPRAPIFAEDDLSLIQMLADQVAVVIESRQLADEAARVRAREEAARLKEDFLSTAAHDLKTPLTALILQAQQLVRRAARSPAAPADPADLERIVREGERLRTIVFSLLDAARTEQARLVVARQELDLAAALRDVVHRCDDGYHTFALEAPEALLGRYDAARMVQVLENLVENAIKYSPDGGLITIRLWQDADGVNLTVRDQGIGIPAEDLPRLFDRFHRGANVDDRRFPGWGLGLSICRQIIEQHGGQIGADSSIGAGSTFRVRLPSTT